MSNHQKALIKKKNIQTNKNTAVLIFHAILLVLIFREISIGPELFSPPGFRIQGGTMSVTNKGHKSTSLILDNVKKKV